VIIKTVHFEKVKNWKTIELRDCWFGKLSAIRKAKIRPKLSTESKIWWSWYLAPYEGLFMHQVSWSCASVVCKPVIGVIWPHESHLSSLVLTRRGVQIMRIWTLKHH